MNASAPVVKNLLLVGGGHSHLFVLKHLGMRPVPGLAVTLVSKDILTPYSGSLPAFLSGSYTFDQMHIDLAPLAQFAGARLIQEEVTAIDLEAKTIALDSRPDLHFDLLSLNVGSVPDSRLIPGALQYAIGIKPIDQFIRHWQDIKSRALVAVQQDLRFHLAVIGGGPASVEFCLAAQASIHRELGISVDSPSRIAITLITANKTLLTGHNSKVQHYAQDELTRRGIDVLLNHEVTEIGAGKIHVSTSDELTADAIVYATGASLPAWVQSTGLNLGNDGFIEVHNTLQSSSHPFVFAAGDAATIAAAPRPKSGVYAVRHGKILANNLLAFAHGKRLRRYHPQREALALMSLSNNSAIASRGNFSYRGKLAWKFKHRIDNAFLKKFSELPEMAPDFALSSGLVDKATEQELKAHAIRCAGCGAKVAGDVLQEVLSELAIDQSTNSTRISTAEDAAIIELDNGSRLLQSVDLIKAFTNDPWLFARIATNHCLSDLHAMGVQADSAQALVGLPPAIARITRHQLNELMQACKEELNAEDCKLIGGHSAESETLQFGLCVNALIFPEQKLLLKTGMRQGDVLILGKALGTGTLLAAHMRLRASYKNLQACYASMLQSNREAARIFVDHQASACTDITGFGLAGHLLEMLGKHCQVTLELSSVNAIDGALYSLEKGISSSLHKDNSLALEKMDIGSRSPKESKLELLFDPQTAGGLLASVPGDNAEACLVALRAAGYEAAAIIGTVDAQDAETPLIRVV